MTSSVMNQLEYQTAFHPGPFAASAQQPGSHLSQHAYSQGHTFATPPQQQQQATAPSHAQAFATAPYPGHAAPNGPQVARSQPHFHDAMQQHHSPHALTAGQQSPYTSAPFSHPTSATATPTPPLQQQPLLRHSASPQQVGSPYAASQPQISQQPKQQTPPVKYPMAAPPLPQTPASAAQQAGASNATASPQSPGSQSRENQRLELLFDINVDLLQEVNSLQVQGKGGATSPQQQMQLKAQGMDDKLASDEFIQCMRRLQANLAYLAPRSDAAQMSKAPPGPAHMSAPPHMPQLQQKYEQLRELFPGWGGIEARAASTAVSPGNGNGTGNGMMNPMNSMNGMNQANPAMQA